MNMFATATRNKMRFSSSVGQLTVEQLWDLPLESSKGPCLDHVGMQALRELRAFGEESLIDRGDSKVKKAAELTVEIVRFVIETKQADVRAAEDKVKRAQRKDQLLSALARKEGAALEKMSEDDIRAAIDSL